MEGVDSSHVIAQFPALDEYKTISLYPTVLSQSNCFGLIMCGHSLPVSSWQVKVRGVRVSLEEVEMLACKAAGFPVGAFSVAFEPGRATIKRNRSSHGDPKTDGTIAAVASCHPDRGRLVGFFVPNEEQKSQDGLVKLKRQLAVEMTAAQLPAVLMPVLGEFPLTPNGKVRWLEIVAVLLKYTFIGQNPAAQNVRRLVDAFNVNRTLRHIYPFPNPIFLSAGRLIRELF